MPKHEGDAQRKFLGPIKSALKYFFVGCFIFLLVQVLFTPPERRAINACFAPYKLARVINSGFKAAFPEYPRAHIEASNWIEDANDSCIYYLDKVF